jgi:hypothetical protein
VNSLIFIILLAAIVCDIGVPFFLGRRYPNYSHFLDPVSKLGVHSSPVKEFERLNLIVIGLLFMVFSTLEHFLFSNNSVFVNLYSIGIGVFGAGSVLAGIFPEDEKHSVETPSGKIHGIASGIGFLLLGLNPLWALWISEFQTIATANIILFFVATFSFILFLFSEKREKGMLKFTGLFQRLNMTTLYFTLIINFAHAFL